VLQRLQHHVGAEGEHGVAAPACDVAEGVRQVGFPYADGPDDGDVVMRLDEAQRGELVEERTVELDLRGRVPALELAVGLGVGALRAERGGLAIAARGLIAERQEREVLVRHLPLARQRETLEHGVEHAGELQAAQHRLQLGRDDVGVHSVSPSSLRRSRRASGRAYWVEGRR
jgi:hypothetical protein